MKADQFRIWVFHVEQSGRLREAFVRNIPLATERSKGQDQPVNWIPWITVSGKSLLSSSSFWLLVMATACTPPAWSAFSPWAITQDMGAELSGLAILLGAAWGIHHAVSLRDLWSLGGTATRTLAPWILILLPTLALLLVAQVAQEPWTGRSLGVASVTLLPQALLFSWVARCLVSLPGRGDGLALLWLVFGWLVASHAHGSPWISEFSWDDSRLRHLDDSDGAKSYAQGRVLPILGWAMLSWAICTRDSARANDVSKAVPQDPSSR